LSSKIPQKIVHRRGIEPLDGRTYIPSLILVNG
jgi:hypothetical protein